MSLPSAFADLPAEAFPVVLEFEDRDGTVVHRIEIDGPGAVHIPPLAGDHGPVGVRITFATGETTFQPAPGTL